MAKQFYLSGKPGVKKIEGLKDCDLIMEINKQQSVIDDDIPVTSIKKASDLKEVLYKYFELMTGSQKRSLKKAQEKYETKIKNTNKEVFCSKVFNSLEQVEDENQNVSYNYNIKEEYAENVQLILDVLSEVANYQNTIGKRLKSKLEK